VKLLERVIVLLLVHALALVAGCTYREQKALKGRYSGSNLVIITIDTQRADHLGAYGYHRPTSPTIDSIAEESVLFDAAFTPR